MRTEAEIKACKKCGKTPLLTNKSTKKYNKHIIKCCWIKFEMKSIYYPEKVISAIINKWNEFNEQKEEQ